MRYSPIAIEVFLKHWGQKLWCMFWNCRSGETSLVHEAGLAELKDKVLYQRSSRMTFCSWRGKSINWLLVSLSAVDLGGIVLSMWLTASSRFPLHSKGKRHWLRIWRTEFQVTWAIWALIFPLLCHRHLRNLLLIFSVLLNHVFLPQLYLTNGTQILLRHRSECWDR